jgi:hypothetical protein
MVFTTLKAKMPPTQLPGLFFDYTTENMQRVMTFGATRIRILKNGLFFMIKPSSREFENLPKITKATRRWLCKLLCFPLL